MGESVGYTSGQYVQLIMEVRVGGQVGLHLLFYKGKDGEKALFCLAVHLLRDERPARLPMMAWAKVPYCSNWSCTLVAVT